MLPQQLPEEGMLCLDPHGDVGFKINGLSPKLVEVLRSNDLHPDIMAILPALLEDDAYIKREDPPTDDDQTLHVLLSSKHLILSSTYFAALLKNVTDKSGGFLPGRFFQQTTRSDGVAFIYMLAIIHCRSHLVPSSVPFRILIDMALLVSYYGCYEAVKAVADVWINGLVYAPITDATEDIRLHWIFTAWVFRRNDVFQMMSRDLISESANRIGLSCTLPIPFVVYEKLNEARAHNLEHLIAKLFDIRENIAKGCRKELQESGPEITRTPSSDMCVYTVVQAHTIHMQQMGLIFPVPEGQFFPGLSISKIISECQQLKVTEGAEYTHEGKHSQCSLLWRLGSVLDEYERPVGLDMNDKGLNMYLPRSLV